jgi:hypothetical protein
MKLFHRIYRQSGGWAMAVQIVSRVMEYEPTR